MEFVTLNTSLQEQNHHQFKKVDDEPQKKLKQSALLRKENKAKMAYSLTKNMEYSIIKFLVKYSTPAAGILSSDMAV